jgi:hypothetical protein
VGGTISSLFCEDNGSGGELSQLFAKLDKISSHSAERLLLLKVERGKDRLGACVYGQFRNIRRAFGGAFGCRAVSRCAPLPFEQFLRTLNRIALIIEKASDAPEQIDVLGPVVASTAAAFEGAHLGELAFPEPKDVLGDIKIVGDFADGAKGAG